MSESEVVKYAKRGIITVAQLACTFRPPRRIKKPEERKLGHSHALQALAVREKKVYILGTPVLPDSPKRLYLDIEGDPERGFCYLLGVIVWDGENEEQYSFWIDSPAEEAALLGQFLDLAVRYADAWIYAYGAYEATFLQRVGKSAGREDEVKRVLTRTCNVLSTVYLHVYFPVHSNGLKDIAGHLGFLWTETEASGLLSLVWRRRWEESGAPDLKQKLETYNIDDCRALRVVTDFLYRVCPRPATAGENNAQTAGQPVARVEDMMPVSSRREWCRAEFVISDFDFINERAYFDYQRDRVFIRTSKIIRQSRSRNRGRRGKRNIPINRKVELTASKCPFCGCAELTLVPHGLLARLAFDLRITRSGVSRWVTRYTTSYHHCSGCKKRFLPWEYLRLDPHCLRLKSWAMNQHVVRRVTLANVGTRMPGSAR